jgi:branched-chain amino acid transport system substrate-binding protein
LRTTPLIPIALALLLTACGGDTPPPTTTALTTSSAAPISNSPSAPANAPTTGATAPTTAPVGGATTVITATNRIVIGVQSPLSGPGAAVGVGLHNGAEIAVAQLARPLRDLGYQVELQALDDQDDPEAAAANAEQLVADADVLCVVGHAASGATRAALPTYAEAQLPLVVPASAGVGITGEAYPNVVRLIGRDDVQATIATRFAAERLEARSAFIVQERSDYGEVLASAFRQRAQADKIALRGSRLIGDDELTEAVRDAAPDVVYLAGRYAQMGPLIGQLRAANITAPLLGPDGLDSPELVRLAGAPLQELYYTTLAPPLERLPFAAQFADDYEARFAHAAPPFAAHTYDATGLCIEAIASAADAEQGRPTRAAVSAALRERNAYDGIVGSYEFAANGELQTAPYYVLRASPSGWSANTVVAELTAPPPPR